MKLSTAIRKGIERDGKQIFGSYFKYDKNSNITGCCAIGAAVIGATTKRNYERGDIDLSSVLFTAFGTASRRDVECPEPRCSKANNARDIIPHLNDKHRWKRERIADWLEGIGL